ncbi:MAG: DUF2892 domain-containing protein [Marinospirillum sp.]|uniref:YgaP family membrane protein n=1 Tax=Marinospirillum sp. TaxID=2183934 RepID=UPI001A020EFE|nr:DUF2892 domain-containing protein [Marinospirillum sp.]MBE0506830.1 DUF2892 domain-containing protein [Marinospirillum sp.]
MNIDRALMMFAGIMILISLLLTHFVHPAFVWLTVFIAANLMQASVTGFCPAVIMLKKLGIKTGCAFK